MPALAPTEVFQDAAERPLPLRMRGDLRIWPLAYGTRCSWVIEDPLTLRYTFLNGEELALLRMLDGQTSALQIQQQYAAQFPPRRLPQNQLQAVLVRLHRHGLLVVDRAGQAQQLLARARQANSLTAKLQQLAAWRLRGINPDPWLTTISAGTNWLFQPASLLLTVLLVVVALLAGLPAATAAADTWHYRDFFQGRNLLLLAAAMALVKIAHELGHALACKRMGRRCHEMGVLVMLGIPCLYCDVSSSWTLPGKWQRAAIAAAGMYIEVILAAICGIIWAFSQPGVLHSLSFHILLVCSVGTILLNGNPLMRYDGYYVLADLMELPNLDTCGRSALRRNLREFFLGVESPRDHLLSSSQQRVAACYAALAWCYRFMVVAGIVVMFYLWLEPYRLEPLAVALGAGLALATVASPLRAIGHDLADPATRRQVNWWQLIRRMGTGSVLLLLLAWIPLPARVSAPAVLEPEEAQRAYVSVSGHIEEAVAPGTRVQPGDILLKLRNPALELQAAEVTALVAQLEQRLASLNARRVRDPAAASEIPETQKAQDDARQRLQRLEEDIARLTLRADRAGIVLPPPREPRRALAGSQLPRWHGTPLDQRNRAAHLEPGTLVCLVGDPQRLDAVAVVSQADVERLQVGQHVTLRLYQQPGQPLSGTVAAISLRQLQQVPAELIGQGDVPVQTDVEQGAKPLEPSYQVRVELDALERVPPAGSRAQCRITTASCSLAWRGYRFLRRTFGL